MRISLSRLGFKLLSVILALLVWFYVVNSESVVKEFTLSLNYLTPVGEAISNEVTKDVKVTVKGSRSFLRSLFTENSKVDVNLKNIPHKRDLPFKVRISPADIPIPFGVKVVSVYPDFIDVTLGRRISKNVIVKPVLSGELDQSLKLMNQSVYPKKVMITGPVSVMRKVGIAYTLPIDRSSLKGKDSIRVQLKEIDPRIEYKKTNEIDFRFDVKPKKANVFLKKLPVNFMSQHRNFRSKSKYVGLEVLIPEGEKKKIRQSDVVVMARVPKKKGRHRVKLEAKLPDGVFLMKIVPSKINVVVY